MANHAPFLFSDLKFFDFAVGCRPAEFKQLSRTRTLNGSVGLGIAPHQHIAKRLAVFMTVPVDPFQDLGDWRQFISNFFCLLDQSRRTELFFIEVIE